MAFTATHLLRRARSHYLSQTSSRDIVASSAYTGGNLIADRYRVTAVLGQGGMGTVYGAIDLATGQPIALKRTLDAASANALELFKREFHTLRGLRHPNIIEVYDYGNDDQGLFYTMELLEGSDLGRAAPLGWRLVCEYLRQIATPLGLLHARRLLHRDISPRNVWVFPDGRLKLIDFGALSPFGVPTEVVGTLPLLAPEWLLERSTKTLVDQRADLYSLGALGYWLLTGQHAYRVESEEDLPHCWTRSPDPPSARLRLLKDRELESIPAELDALILALLRPDATARPETTERLIDRIDGLIGPTTEPTDHAMRGCLLSQAFVGRSSELQLFKRSLSGAGVEYDAIALEAESGMGRSRLLDEMSLVATLCGATSVLVRAEKREQAYGVASAIALGLIERMRGQARVAARPHASVFAQLSSEVQRELELPTEAATETYRRLQLQQALTEWLYALAGERRIVLLVDDIERADEESVSWLAAIVRQHSSARVFVVVAMESEPPTQRALPLDALRRAAQTIQLSPLTEIETQELLQSVFGPVRYLGRIAHVVHRASQGIPAHCAELIEYLVERNVVRYDDGTWTLPGHLSESELPRGRHELHLVRLQGVSVQAQLLAQVLSIEVEEISLAHCVKLSELSASETAAALVELVLAGVLAQSQRGYRFRHSSVREHALAALSPTRRNRAHERLGESLMRDVRDPVDRLRAGLHLLQAGESRRSQTLVWEAVWSMLQSYDAQARLSAAIPLLEEVLALYRRRKVRLPVRAVPLMALAVASYSTDSRLARRYGSDALATVDRLLCFGWARVLRPFIGRKLALYTALAFAALARRRRIGELIYLFVATENALHGVATSNFDHALLAQCAYTLEPLEVLGDHNIAGMLCRATRSVAAILTEDHAKTLAQLRAVVALIESDAPIRNAPKAYREDITGCMLFPIGLMECWRMNPEVLSIADRIASSVSLNAQGADHLRAVYYAMRGERKRAEMYHRRVEILALQSGTAWQVVMLGPLNDHFTSLWTHDALLAKHAAAELERLSRQLPTLRHEARRARATHFVLCGRYREAIELIGSDDTPKHLLGWTRGQGVLARAHNRLGEHSQAREVCESALAARSEADLDFVVMNLHVQLELALAEAALGEYERAGVRMDRLLAKHAASIGPLLLGAIHETCARAGLLQGNFPQAHSSWVAMRDFYAMTQSAILLELSDQLGEQIGVAQSDDGASERRVDRRVAVGDDVALVTRTHVSRASGEMPWRERALRGLRFALAMTDAETGFVVPCDEGEVLHLDTDMPDAEAVQWAKRVRSGNAEQTADMMPDAAAGYTACYQSSETLYCVLSLGSSCPAAAAEPAVLVLGFRGTNTGVPDPLALSQLARSLRAML